MSIDINYPDTGTIVSVEPSPYGNTKIVTAQAEVAMIFVQNTGFSVSNFQEQTDSDALCYPDPENYFILANFNRLEGMYLLAPLYGAGDDQSWFKIVSVTVYKDHLFDNVVDNIELRLEKARPISGVS